VKKQTQSIFFKSPSKSNCLGPAALRDAIRTRGAASATKIEHHSLVTTGSLLSQPSRTEMGKIEVLPLSVEDSFIHSPTTPVKVDPHIKTSLKRGREPPGPMTEDRARASDIPTRLPEVSLIQGLPMLLSTASRKNAGEMTLSDDETTLPWDDADKIAAEDELSVSSSIFGSSPEVPEVHYNASQISFGSRDADLSDAAALEAVKATSIYIGGHPPAAIHNK
jgi:hypothetical protein